MADITTYKRATVTYFSTAAGIKAVQQGEVRAAADAVVTANPAYWVALTDADATGGVNKIHP
jgi:hypothetical protein